ncbi:MAG: transcription antiterminator [Clostridiaceae bacterium]
MLKISSKEEIKEKLLLTLLESTTPITVSDLTKETSKSEKTIRKYLGELEEELVSKGISLNKKPNVGVYVELNEKEREFLKDTLIKNKKSIDKEYSSEYRQKYILKTLFKNRYSYTIQLLAEDLYCSKSTIVNDLAHVEKWLENKGIKLIRRPNQGLWIEGSEESLREAMIDLFHEITYENEDELNEEIEDLDYRVDFNNFKKIKELFPRIDLFKIQSIIQESEEKLKYYFTDEAFTNLIIHIAITIERSKSQREIIMSKESLEQLKETYEFEVAKWVISRLKEEFQIDLPEDEVGYISLHMLGAKIQQDNIDKDYNLILESQDKLYIGIAKDIIHMISDILNVDLNNDNQLLTGLVIHLRPTVVRLQHGLKLRNPLLKRIKEEYSSIFVAVLSCSSIFEERLGVFINEDEVGYIALHVAVAMSKLDKKYRVAVVCSSGFGTSQLVASRLESRLNEIEIVSVLPLNRLTDQLINDMDLIISTIPVRKPNPKIILVSALVNDIDISKVREKLNNLSLAKKEKKGAEDNNRVFEKVETDIIDEKLCFIDNERTSFIDIIEHYGSLMEQMGYAKKGFSEDILAREKKGSTAIWKGIAIPHSKETFVNKSKICIIKLDNPVLWNGQRLSLIIILCLKFKDIETTRVFFKNFYSTLNDHLILEKIIKTSNKEEIIKIFLNGGNDNE